MIRKLVSLFLSAMMLLSMTGAAAEGGVTVTDMMGREVTLTQPATRIVALTASDCEILCALGAEDTLVGRGEYCDYPESILDVPAVQSGAETNIEQIIALEPQVVLMSAMAQDKDQVDTLEQAGIQVVVSNAQDIAGVYTAIRLIGALMGKDDEAEAIVADMQATFDDIAAKSENTGKTVYFEVSPLEYGLWTAGKNTFMDELAAMCGLTNAFADVDGWAQISEEQVLERDPDYIVTTSMYWGEGPTPVEEIMGRTGWENLKAIQNAAVLNADSNEITRPGPRLKDAAVTLFQFVNGDEALEPAA
ncbi:MAG: ABC transporter substrate-binding protein [Candidatus Limiplasma sp.]|nr:ABC transporter substrate-binding protein [Candidatus Limiplasma sp.]